MESTKRQSKASFRGPVFAPVSSNAARTNRIHIHHTSFTGAVPKSTHNGTHLRMGTSSVAILSSGMPTTVKLSPVALSFTDLQRPQKVSICVRDAEHPNWGLCQRLHLFNLFSSCWEELYVCIYDLMCLMCIVLKGDKSDFKLTWLPLQEFAVSFYVLASKCTKLEVRLTPLASSETGRTRRQVFPVAAFCGVSDPFEENPLTGGD